MKIILKKILRSSLTKAILAWIGYAYLWFVFKTTRWSYVGLEHLEHHIKTNTPFIAAFWHGRLAMMPFIWRWNKPFYMLLSEHEDGRFIAKVVSHHNIKSIYGSSTRGGAQAAFSCIKELKQGHSIGITPDGPKGPRHEASMGLIHIARLSGAPIMPVSYALKRHKFLKTWDKFLVPLPFSNGIYVIGKPILISHTKDDEALDASRALLALALIKAETDADSYTSNLKV
jgi:lysophospholipid acyltransferase (LPLAT)-like uncharacterized protein